MCDNNIENNQSDGGEACAPQIIIIIYLIYIIIYIYMYIIWEQRKCVCMADYTRTKQTLT